MTSIRALLEAGAWDGCRVIGGDGGLDRDVADVQLILDLDAPAIRPTRLMLVATTPDPDDWRLDVLLRRMHRAGASGLVVPSATAIGSSSIRVANMMKMPLIVSDLDTVELTKQSQLLLLRFELQAAGLVIRMHTELGRRTLDTVELVERASAILRSNVSLISPSGQVIEGRIEAPMDWVPAGSTTWHRGEDDTLWVAAPVRSVDGTKVESWLMADFPHASPGLELSHGPALEVAAGALQRSHAVARLQLDRQFRGRIALLSDLLRAGERPSPLVLDRVSAAGWTLDGWHLGFHFELNGQHGGETENEQDKVFDILAPLLSRHAGPMAFAEHGEGVAGWITTDLRPDAQAAEKLAASLRGDLRQAQQLGMGALVLGVSRAYEGAGGVGRAVSEAVAAAALARGRSATGGFVYVGRYGAPQLLLAWTGADSFRASVFDLLAPIQQDRRLIPTLLAYLDCSGSTIDAAAILGVHRNTVSARIARIERALDVRLDDPDTRLGLHLACRSLVRGAPTLSRG